MQPPSTPEADPRLRVYYDLARAMTQIEDTGELLGRMLDAILDVFACERGLIGLLEPESEPGSFRRITRVRGSEARGDIIISPTLLEALVERRRGVIARAPRREEGLVEEKTLIAMGVPLLLGERVLGFIYVDDVGDSHRFCGDDLDFMSALAHIAAAAFNNAERYQQFTANSEILRAESPLEELLGDSPPMRQLKAELRKFAKAPRTPVLIQGESGTGKELVARTLHALSPRASMPLVALNCAAIPEALVESELFGHLKGAFAGALNKKRGRFELAHRGTLFLDEIGDLSLSAQAKVLRAVEEGEVQPLGSETTFKVDVRILSATHKDLEAEVAAGRFREDLFYRLNALELRVPPLRERAEDIPRLAQTFLEAAERRVGKRVAGFSAQALAALVRYPFPGNVRELQNEVERALIGAEGGGAESEAAVITLVDLSERMTGMTPLEPPKPYAKRTLTEMRAELEPQERALVEEALERGKGSIAEAARLLGISRSMLKVRLKRFGLTGLDESDPN